MSIPSSGGSLVQPGTPFYQLQQSILKEKQGGASTSTVKATPVEAKEDKDEEYKSPVSAMLNQVNGLMGKMGKTLPGFGKPPDDNGQGAGGAKTTQGGPSATGGLPPQQA